MIGSMQLLDELRERGFTPHASGEPWFDLAVQPWRKVRVELDDNTVIVRVMTGDTAPLWDVRLSDGTPAAVAASVIDQAIARAFADCSDSAQANRDLRGADMGLIGEAAHAAGHAVREASEARRTVDYYMNRGRAAAGLPPAGAQQAAETARGAAVAVRQGGMAAARSEPVRGDWLLNLTDAWIGQHCCSPTRHGTPSRCGPPRSTSTRANPVR